MSDEEAGGPKRSGSAWIAYLATPLGAALGALVTALLEPIKGNPAWIVVLILALGMVALLVAIAAAWIRGDIVHKREVRRLNDDHNREIARLRQENTEIKADRGRWMQLAWMKDQTNAVMVDATIKALGEHAGEAPA